MQIGDSIKFIYDSFCSELIMVSHSELVCNGQKYINYNMHTGHILYVKDTFSLPQEIDIKDHLIDSVKEINGGDYYLKINKTHALPL